MQTRRRSYRGAFDYDSDRLGIQVEHLTVGRGFNPRDRLRPAPRLHREPRPAPHQPAAARPRLLRQHEPTKPASTTSPTATTPAREPAGAGRVRGEMHSSDTWTVELRAATSSSWPRRSRSRTRRWRPAAITSPTLRAGYTLGSQRRVSGDVTFATGGFYGGDPPISGFRGRAEVTPRLSLEPGVSVNWVDMPTGPVHGHAPQRARHVLVSRTGCWRRRWCNTTRPAISSRTNVRFRWEYLPGSEIFVVYSDGRDTLSELRAPSLLSRGFTVKATRLFRF